MKMLLRSCFVASPTDNRDFLFKNYLELRASSLGFEVLEDQVIWNFVVDFASTHNHVPDMITLQSHFEHVGEKECGDRLDLLATLPCLTRGDFTKRLQQKDHDRKVRRVLEVLKEAGTILSTGMKLDEGRKGETILKGPLDAVRHFLHESHSIVQPPVSGRLSGNVPRDGEDFREEYDRIKADPLAGLGQMCGLQQIDEVLRGARKKQLWIHAGFTGSLKSTFALNWAYTQSVYYQESVFFLSLEMPYDQVRRILYAMHSIHEKFRDARIQLGLQKDPNVSVGLNAKSIRDGELTPQEEEFLKQWVIPDFNDPENEYGSIHVEVADPDKHDFTVIDLRAKAELMYASSPFAMIIVDHVGRMSSRRWVPSTTERQNEIIADLKKLAMSFNMGAGIAVLALFQISREGFRHALKSQEKTGVASYNLTHLSYANECERSGDIITASWTDEDLKKRNRAMFQCLKTRDDEHFPVFLARMEYPCRRIFTVFERPLTEKEREDMLKAVEQDDSNIADLDI